MTTEPRETRRKVFLEILEDHDLRRSDVAELLHVSTHTVASWTKPETSKSSSAVPLWAIELLGFKLPLREVSS